MAISRGSRSLLLDAGGWVFACAIAAVAIVYQSELKMASYQLLGLTPPDFNDTASANSPRTATGQPATSGRQVELRAGSNGHFITDAEANGRRIEVMIDTGASVVALTYEDAQTIGVTPSPRDFTHSVSTANGMSRVAPVMLDRVMIGDIMVRNVQAVVAERGKLNITLLGNSFLSRVSYRMAQGRLLLED
jgi:aspartyl protease family protein